MYYVKKPVVVLSLSLLSLKVVKEGSIGLSVVDDVGPF